MNCEDVMNCEAVSVVKNYVIDHESGSELPITYTVINQRPSVQYPKNIFKDKLNNLKELKHKTAQELLNTAEELFTKYETSDCPYFQFDMLPVGINPDNVAILNQQIKVRENTISYLLKQGFVLFIDDTRAPIKIYKTDLYGWREILEKNTIIYQQKYNSPLIIFDPELMLEMKNILSKLTTVEARDDKIIYWLSFDEATSTLILNDIYIVNRFKKASNLIDCFKYLWANRNQRISTKDWLIKFKINDTKKSKFKLSDIVSKFGIRKELRKVFTPDTSNKDGVILKDKITQSDLDLAEVDVLDLGVFKQLSPRA